MSTATMEIGEPATDAEWHAWRAMGLGASDTPKLLGVSRWGTPLDVYLAKIGEAAPVDETEEMRNGHDFELSLAAIYERQTGRKIIATQRWAECEQFPFVRATLDAVTACGRVVQFKSSGGEEATEYGEPGSDDVPRSVLVQEHHEMLVADAPVADVCVLLGRFGLKVQIHTIERSAEWDDLILETARDFQERIITRTPPTPRLPADNRNLARLFKPNGATITLPHDVCEEAFRREAMRAQIRAMEGECEQITAKLRQELGEASVGILSDGRLLKRRVTEVAERTQTIKAHRQDYLQLVKGPR